MGNCKKQEPFEQYQYYLYFEYNGKPYRKRSIFTNCLLGKANKSTLIAYAFNAAESLLQLEGKLVSEGELSHIRLYDKNMKLLASKD